MVIYIIFQKEVQPKKTEEEKENMSFTIKKCKEFLSNRNCLILMLFYGTFLITTSIVDSVADYELIKY